MKRGVRWAALAVMATVALLVATLAMPVRVWRTGEEPVAPIPLVPAAGEALQGRLWVDTDAACGAGPHVDPDDCFALLLLMRSGRPHVEGISTVAGNAPLDIVDSTVSELVGEARRDGASPAPVFHGDEAPAALRNALERGPITILALGPLTNVAAALRGRPDLVAHVERLVVVMGRRKGHLFHPSEGRGEGMLFGHGPVFRDFNYAYDPRAAALVLRLGAPLVMVPYDAARHVKLRAADLDALAAAGGVAHWVASRARNWLRYWREEVGLDGFYPFDLLAAAYLLRPGSFGCAGVRWWIRPAPLPLEWLGVADPLFVGLQREQPEGARAAGAATYCPFVQDGLHDWLLRAMR